MLQRLPGSSRSPAPRGVWGSGQSLHFKDCGFTEAWNLCFPSPVYEMGLVSPLFSAVSTEAESRVGVSAGVEKQAVSL